MLAAKFAAIFPHLDERQRRLLMGAEARTLGRGGIRLVARAAGVREATVALGVDELEAGAEPLGRARRPGGGRKRAAELDPGLRPALLALVEPQERGDPMSALRWTTKSTRKLAAELACQGHKVSADTIGDLLREEGFSLQGNAKTIEGRQHPDRDAQFRYISEQVRACQGDGDPVISVDTKKKELVGPFRNGGREWRPKGEPGSGRAPMTSRTRNWARPFLTGSMTWLRTPAGCPSGPTMTPPRSPSSRSAAGGTRQAGPPTRAPAGCWSPPMRAAPTATGPARGKLSWPPSRCRPGWRSRCATSRPAPPSGTRSSTGCSPTSR